MAVPHTLFALDNIRPDLLIFRAMSTCLILWDDADGARPTTSWVRSKLPALLLQGLFAAPLRAAEARAEAAAAALVLEAKLEQEEKEAALRPPAAARMSVLLDEHGDEDDDEDYDPFAADNAINANSWANANANIGFNPSANSGSRSSSSSSSNQQPCMSTRSSFQALVCILAGNAWGLALRYAGTSNRWDQWGGGITIQYPTCTTIPPLPPLILRHT